MIRPHYSGRFEAFFMQRVNEFVFYELAIKVHHLTALEGSSIKYSDKWFDLAQARDAVDEIYRQRPLNFTAPVAFRLYQAINAVVPQEWNEIVAKMPGDGQDENPIEFRLVWEIKEAAKEFETILSRECQVMDTYFVSKKGTYSTKELVESAHYQVPESYRSTLTDQTKKDLDQAGKCIAFDVPTAAAFHLLRATEDVLRQYYDEVVPGPKKAPPKMRNWGTYIRLLKNNGADEVIVSLLTYMKNAYRNPVLHPEENYTDERAQVLFGICISAIVSMIEALKAVKAKGGILPFPATGNDVP